MRIHVPQRSEITVEKPSDHFAKEAAVVGEADPRKRLAALRQGLRQKVELRALAGAVDPFENDEFAAGGRCHGRAASVARESGQRRGGMAR